MCLTSFLLTVPDHDLEQVFPKQLMLERLPSEVDILCAHPMFGPTSGAGSWKGLNFQFEKVLVLKLFSEICQ
jgi:hypothetical protein